MGMDTQNVQKKDAGEIEMSGKNRPYIDTHSKQLIIARGTIEAVFDEG